jgi:ABC-type sugar transport system permease subunit
MVAISAFPDFNKGLFVEETGNIKIIGLGLGLLLAILIYIKWKYAKILFYVIFIPVLIVDIALVLTMKEFVLSFILLGLSHLSLVLFFRFSKKINEHFSTLPS